MPRNPAPAGTLRTKPGAARRADLVGDREFCFILPQQHDNPLVSFSVPESIHDHPLEEWVEHRGKSLRSDLAGRSEEPVLEDCSEFGHARVREKCEPRMVKDRPVR